MKFENLEQGRKYYTCRHDPSRVPVETIVQTLVYLGYFETDINSPSCERPYFWYQFSHYGQDYPCVSVPSRKQLEMSYYETIRELLIELNRELTPWGKIERHDAVVLTTDLPDNGLRIGDVGTVMYSHSSGDAYEVDFVDGDGGCVASIKLGNNQLRKWQRGEILHTRPITK